ncbi:LysR family transcriptional regulator [Saccharopolyspora sp. WRP15-2]|uniref:LysR family transcriptional regulator n=1 Tax=Saccharopolyspora oryzae TaxID=2997343 RepID=A0ABT4UV39_9PSEU|nr:LysR family transcriptional regulator [Saccharopolyspora oryzae]MDA3625581.1 LysR family transcriptional regulator [Saccharopolyspora oryzae]
MSQQIRGLERELGEALFYREPRSVRLSPAGEALLPHARAALSAVAAAQAEFAARSGLLTGDLGVGTVDGAHITALPDVLGAFHRRYPGVSVRLVSGTSGPLLSQVRTGALDAAVVARPRQSPDDLEFRTLLRDEIVAVVPHDHPAVEAGRISLAALADTPLIGYGSDSGLRPHLEEAFDTAGAAFRPAYTANDVALQIALAAAGAGIALTPAAEVVGDSVTAVALSPAIPYEKALAWRRTPAPAAPLRAFLALHEEAGR